uniref:Thymidine kinase n=1 Tax=Spermophilus dauricus TaxID=99837 RepID=A0A8C9PPB2_SPEDA
NLERIKNWRVAWRAEDRRTCRASGCVRRPPTVLPSARSPRARCWQGWVLPRAMREGHVEMPLPGATVQCQVLVPITHSWEGVWLTWSPALGTLERVLAEAALLGASSLSVSPQFPDIVEFCESMANAGKTVIVAALDGTFQRKAFGAILNLVPLAESVVKLTAVCMECFREAAYTKRLGLEKEVEVIGGADKYHSVCRLCYFKKSSSVQPAGQDNKENCPALGRAGEAAAVRKLFAPQQVLQCSPTN